MQTKFEKLIEGLQECKAALGVITPEWLNSLTDDEFEHVVTTFNKWFASVQSLATYLAATRKQQNT